MKKGDIIEGVITDYSFPNRGSFAAEDRKVIVKNAFPGQKVRCRIVKKRSSHYEAVTMDVLEESPMETEKPVCHHFFECGGCTLQEMSYDAQLRLKTEQVRAKISRLGGIDEAVVHDCIGAENLKYYRNKAVFAVGPHGEVGFVKGKTHFVMDIDDCLLQTDAAMVCADALRAFLKQTGVRSHYVTYGKQ